MEKLPPTSYVRMVDVWLIFGQLIPFIEVTLLTIMELYNFDMDRVNHHGTAINLKSSVSIFWCITFNLIIVTLGHQHCPTSLWKDCSWDERKWGKAREQGLYQAINKIVKLNASKQVWLMLFFFSHEEINTILQRHTWRYRQSRMGKNYRYLNH